MKRPTNKRPNDDEEEDEEEDRKPPAREIHVTPPRRPKPPPSSSPVARWRTPASSEESSLKLIPALAAATPASVGSIEDEELKPRSKKKPISSGFSSQWWYSVLVLSGLTCLSSVGLFLYAILPTAAFAVLTLWWMSLLIFLQSIVAYGFAFYNEQVQHGDGLGRFLLSDSLMEQLTQTSLHEWMTNPRLGNEYRHLMLYFLPLSDDQLQYFLQQLAPVHRRRLVQPGLGRHFLGDSLLRVLMGNDRFRTWAHATSTNTVPASPQMPHRRRRRPLPPPAYDDDASSLGLDVSSNDLAGGNSAVSRIAARRLAALLEEEEEPEEESCHDESDNESDNESDLHPSVTQQDVDLETRVLWNAVTTMTVWNPIARVTQTLFPSRRTLGLLAIGISVVFGTTAQDWAALSFGGLGLGWTVWRQRRDPAAKRHDDDGNKKKNKKN